MYIPKIAAKSLMIHFFLMNKLIENIKATNDRITKICAEPPNALI
jgi:hypothetical protein